MGFMSSIRENGTQTAGDAQRVMRLPVDSILPNPDQSRQIFDDSELWQLSYSIRTYGVMQPVIVRRLGPGAYQLVAGERRLRASKLAGKKTIPAILLETDHDASMIMNIIENTHRSNLNFVEEAKGYAHCLKRCGCTAEELAKKLGKNPYEIENKVRILQLPPDVVQKLAGHNLTEFHANSLLRLKDRPLQRELIDIIISRGFDVAQTDAYVDKLLSGRVHGTQGRQSVRDARLVSNTLEQMADMLNRSGLKTSVRSRELKNCTQYTITVARQAYCGEQTSV